MSAGKCSVDECARIDIQARGYCRMHYFRWYRNGSTDLRRVTRRSRGICTVHACGKPDCGPHGLCNMHKARMDRNGDPMKLMGGPPPKIGADNPNWTGAEATYSAVHLRLRKQRGRASAHPCADCGATAAQWSYNRSDPRERVSTEGPYSVDLEHYVARCISCHKRFDLGHGKAAPHG